jgi:signal transduction histidine kinase/CheY-like chemotaxis protein/HPt (histidine-containing phosphotransfer) domain-containing protein
VTIRRLFGTLLALCVLLAAALFAITVLQGRTAAERTQAEHDRVTSFGLSDQMRQSSNDLTRMVRLYATTGDARYRRYYDEILAIRRGEAPRPREYDSSFWDRVLAEGEAGVAYGPPRSLQDLMRAAHFAPQEFAALNASLEASDKLARVEEAVIRDGGPGRLVDDAYHRQKGTIMAAIERFTALVDARTARRSDELTRRTDRLLVIQTLTLVTLGLVAAALFVLAAQRIAQPLQRLTAVTRRIAQGDWSTRAPTEGVVELKRLGENFNEMADAVERDLAARRAAEAEARSAERRLQTIADRVPGAVFQFAVDADGALSARFFSRGGEHMDFRSFARNVLADDRGAWLDGMVGAARAGTAWHHEYRVHAEDGGVAWMEAHALGSPNADGSGELYGYVTDVTERKALEAELRNAREQAEAADRAKSRFLATISHELRTPLVAVSGTLDVLSTTRLTAEQRDLTEIALRSARSLLALIGDVLDFSKIEAGHLDIVTAPVDVGALVGDLAAQHRQAAAAKGLTLTATVAGDLAPAYEADAIRLRQVLGNLVGNAIKFTDRGEVRLRAESGLTFTVADDGVGIGDRDRLFNPFTQVGERRQGTGLGLVICKELVEAMGGSIAVESEPGRGTTVRVELPLAEATPPASAEPAQLRRPLPSRAEADREGSVLLLVEDHPVNREILTRQFEALGFVTDTAGDAEEAAAKFTDGRYGLVFCDLLLPTADGYELTRRLRAVEHDHGRQRTPIVALTASAVRGERERCREAGMDDLVVKPATPATMAATLKRWLPHAAWPPAFDPEVLDELTLGNERMREDVVTRYLETLRADLDALRGALDRGDAALVRRRAHQIAGASRMVGAHAVAERAARLEQAGEDELAVLADQIL